MEDKYIQVAVTAHPYAYQQGTIEVPDDLTTEEEIRTYIEDNLDQVDFQEPDLDYIGTDFERECRRNPRAWFVNCF